jgi:hypothetical protein
MPKDMHGIMSEFKAGTLNSGSPTGPKVTSRKQAIAIGLSEQRAKGKKKKMKFNDFKKDAMMGMSRSMYPKGGMY